MTAKIPEAVIDRDHYRRIAAGQRNIPLDQVTPEQAAAVAREIKLRPMGGADLKGASKP